MMCIFVSKFHFAAITTHWPSFLPDVGDVVNKHGQVVQVERDHVTRLVRLEPQTFCQHLHIHGAHYTYEREHEQQAGRRACVAVWRTNGIVVTGPLTHTHS